MRCADCMHAEPLGTTSESLSCRLADSSGSPAHPESMAVAFDTEGYCAWLSVDPDFGCVQFKRREAAEKS